MSRRAGSGSRPSATRGDVAAAPSERMLGGVALSDGLRASSPSTSRRRIPRPSALTRADAHTTIDPDRPLSREGALIMNHGRIQGVLSPVVTPFRSDLSPDAERFVRHCQWLLTQNVGLAVFGTNSEANSLSADEKIALLDTLVAAGLDPAAHDARHRLLRAPRHGAPHRARHEARMRRRADAAALLLQGRERRGAVPQLRRSDRAGRRSRGCGSTSTTSRRWPRCRSPSR